jgi:adenosylcobyric acid synthase
MLAGTGSDVGKSILATALCRIFRQDGYHPAPFKAQNMALNSYATPDGREIGRAQAVQAEAAGLDPETDMNPLLLKPSSDHTSQVVLNGRPIGNRDAYDYFRREGREELRTAVNAAFDRLASHYNPIVMEGAGSISEINLRDTDLVNMPMARHADARVILVADIDRGGVFASAYGSIMLQTPADRQRIVGIIINKFRGNLRLFEDGRRMMEEICGVPVLGVVPYLTDVHIEEEDSVALSGKAVAASEGGKVNVAVVLLRHLSNFTDFYSLEQDPRVHLFYTNNTEELRKADLIVVPGSKSTIDDLRELRSNGTAQAILQAHRQGATVVGICGGYQMMGLEIHDPEGVEGDCRSFPGLGLLPVRTVLTKQKTTRQVKFRFRDDATVCAGYEIHMGRTEAIEQPSPACRILGSAADAAEAADGYYADAQCFGTYIHGILDNPSVVDALLSRFAERLSPSASPFDYRAFKEQQYDLLADRVRECLDMDRIYQSLKE